MPRSQTPEKLTVTCHCATVNFGFRQSNNVALPSLKLTRLNPFNLAACGLSACCPTLKTACYHTASKDLLPGGWPTFRGGSRTRWIMRPCLAALDGHRIRPFSHSANVTTNCYSRPLERCITDFGADDAFAKVPNKLKEHYGISIPSHAPRTITEKHAKKINDSKSLKDLFPKNGAEYIIAETDGSMIPIVTIAARTTDEESSDGRKRRKVGWKEGRLSLAHSLGSVTPISRPSETGWLKWQQNLS